MRRWATILVLAALGCAALSAGSGAIRSFDFGWHLRAGESILEHHGRPPRADPIAYTSGSAEWIDHEWLFQLILALLVQAGGLKGAWLLKQTLILVGVLVPAAWLLRMNHSPLAVASLGVLALAGGRFRFSARPEMVAVAFLPALLIVLVVAHRRARRGARMVPLLALVPILVLGWVNLHLSALLAALLVVVFALAVLIEQRGTDRISRPFLVTAVLAGAALLANPYGTRLLAVPFSIHTALTSGGLTNPEWGSALHSRFGLFWTVLLAAGTGLLLARRAGRRMVLPVAACAAVLAVAGGAAARTLSCFYMALPVCALAVTTGKQSGAAQEVRAGWRGRVSAGAAVGLPLLAAGLFMLFPGGAPGGVGLAPGRFPEAMASTYQEMGLRGPIYNPVRFGGYLSWALAPQKVFIDGRNEVHGELLSRLAACRMATRLECWDRLVERWDTQAAFVEYDPRRIPVRLPDGRFISRSVSSVYFRRDSWALVDWDDVAMLLVRRGGRNAERIDGQEDRVLMPEDPEYFYRELRAGRIDWREAQREVSRRLARHPDSRKARLLQEIVRRLEVEVNEGKNRPPVVRVTGSGGD
ncbi:MAG: hypothetical protein ACE5HD_03775 [Acidobacteriota bacterium]